ncbi:MAG TPA: POTRA domain-containing protein [Bryobacteraceae bacterium]|nr:POTRA domain-containing protein [Bryobacteraceae bacterium]
MTTAAVWLMWGATVSAQAPGVRIRPPSVLPISSITIAGNQKLKTDAILGVLGLKVKDQGSTAIFNAARDRLLDTGYFDTISYSYRQKDLGFAVTFTVSEMQQVYPIRVQGLPVTPAGVADILHAKDPLFNGLLPGTKKAVDRSAEYVQQSLSATNPDIHVRARVIPTSPDHYEVEFSPAEGLPVIADMTFEGSSAVSAADLHTVMIENGIGQPYSEENVKALLDQYVRPLFEKEGHMRVRFPRIVGNPAEKVKGIDVRVTVDDGPVFKLGQVSVRGAGAGDSKRILRMANIQTSGSGAVINGDEITKGVGKIQDVLRGEGHLDAKVSVDRSIHDATETVDVAYDVDPGPVYTLGKLTVTGLGLDGEAAIRKMWTVKPGDPYPGNYPKNFVEEVKKQGLFDNLGDISATPSINHDTHVVDVTLNFVSATSVLNPKRPL